MACVGGERTCLLYVRVPEEIAERLNAGDRVAGELRALTRRDRHGAADSVFASVPPALWYEDKGEAA